MNTFEARAELAVANALRQLGEQTGRPVDVALVERRWPEYGIRTADLQGAIARMCHTERLRLFRDGDRDLIAMTPEGAAWSRALPGWLEYALLVPRRIRVAENFRPSHGRISRDLSRKSDGGRSKSDQGRSTMAFKGRTIH